MGSDFSTVRSAALFERACQSLATGVSSGIRRNATPVPLYFERAEGPYFFDVDGHKLLDYTLAWGPLIAGSNHPLVTKRVVAQITRGTTFGAQHQGEIDLAERLTNIIPDVEQVIFSNSGSEAVQAALRLARAYTGRDKFIKFEGHYHGWLNNVLVSYRPGAKDPVQALPGCGGQPPHEYADTLIVSWNDPEALKRAFADNSGQIAAVIVEPLLANSGCCLPDPGYLDMLVALCHREGAVSIFDEVITGFRLALGGARSYFGVVPDLSVYGKALAGGFPLSAVGGRREVFRVLIEGKTFHAGTYNGHAVNVAAALGTLDVLEEPGTFERMHAHGQALRVCLEQTASQQGLPLVTTGAGTVFSVHFGLKDSPRQYRETWSANASLGARFRAAMLERGILLLPDNRWYVSAVHMEPELDLAKAAIEASLTQVARMA